MSILDNITLDMVKADLDEQGIPCPNDLAEALNLSRRVANADASQSRFCAWLINLTQGNVTNDDLTEALSEAFPGAKVGRRHGAHFASLSRSGKLKGARYSVPKKARAKKDTEVNRLRRAVEAIRDARTIKEVRAIINELDNPTTDDTVEGEE